VDHPLPWLRYVDADDVTAADLDLEGMKVRKDAMEKLGVVDGSPICVLAQGVRPGI
jgi:hypothetical protein